MATIDEEISKLQPPACPEEAPLDSTEYCVNCKWMHLVDPTLFQCRRHAPTRDLQCVKCCWPPVELLMHCGDWELAKRSEIDIRKITLKGEK
jgi:hypothetical protein